MGAFADNRDTDLNDLWVSPDWIPLTPGEPHRKVRAIRAQTAGVVAVKTAGSGDEVRLLNFLAGETRYGMFLQVEEVPTEGGTPATGLEGGV